MKKRTFKKFWIPAFAGMTIALSLFFANQAKAEEAVTIHLQIKTNDSSLYDQNITVTACDDSKTASTTSVNAKCAVEQSGLLSDWSWWGDDAFLNSIGSYVNNADGNGVYWGWFSNLEYGSVALNKHVLANGEKLLLAYNTNPLKISIDNAAPYVNATSTITVEQFGLDASWNPVWTAAASSSLVIDADQIANDSGIYEYMPAVVGEKTIYAKKDGYVDSDSITITAQELATSTIRLQIKTNDSSLYDQNITVTACDDSKTASTTSVNAKCAVEQSGLLSDWSWWGDDAFLNSIGSYVNNADGNGVYWGWFSNLEYGSVALNKHVLANGEKLLLAYNTNPLKISIDNAAPYVNATSTITVEQFGLDASWNPVWTAAASSSLVIDGQDIYNDSGIYIYTATTTTPVLIYGKKNGNVDSDLLAITAKSAPVDNTSNNNQLGGGSVIIPARSNSPAPVATPKVDLNKAIDFLISKQSADGSFDSVLITDWAVIALASANPTGAAAQKAKSYLLTDPSPLVGMNPVSDYARRGLALMSLNINPYNGTQTNYIKKITDLFDGRQFGDASLYNDDIFALLVLNKAGYGADDEMIKTTVDFIIARQQADGSWNGSDLTAAAIQALKPVSALNGVSAALAKARNFLASAQGADGGYGNTYTTAWAMQAIAALGESSASWQKNNNTPENYLALSQGTDGGLEKDDSAVANRIWSTSYAIPAVQGKSWFNIMSSFSEAEKQATASANLNVSDNSLATSTLEILNIATSSPEALITATSTDNLLQIKIDREKPSPEIIKTEAATVQQVKRAAPKVLAVKITSPKTVNAAKKEVLKKPASKTLGVPGTPSVRAKPEENTPAISQPAPKTDFLALTGRLFYRGFRYILSLLGF